MKKYKRVAGDEVPAHIVLQVECVLAAGARLRAALQAEGWIDQGALDLRNPAATERWREARAATGLAETEYRNALARATASARVIGSRKDGAGWGLVPIRKTS